MESEIVESQFEIPVIKISDEETLLRKINELKVAIEQIESNCQCEYSFEELFFNVSQIVLSNKGETAYAAVRDAIVSHLQTNVRERLMTVVNDGADISQALNEIWNEYQESTDLVERICKQLDLKYVRIAGETPIRKLAISSFHEQVIRDTALNEKFRSSMLEMMSTLRREGETDCHKFRNTLELLFDIGGDTNAVYEEEFEKPYLQSTADYYKVESLKWLENDGEGYVPKVAKTWLEEAQKLKECIPATTFLKVLEIIQRETMATHLNTVLQMENCGLIGLIEDDRTERLRVMYELCTQVENGVQSIAKTLSSYLRPHGRNIIKMYVPPQQQCETKEAAEFLVMEMITLRDDMNYLLSDVFCDNPILKNSIRIDLDSIFNSDVKFVEYLAIFLHQQLKKPMKQESEIDLEMMLDKCTELFRHIEKKNVFENFYKEYFSRRLLRKTSVNDRVEKYMLQKLKFECGYDFISNLEMMFKDMSTSATLNENYVKFLESQSSNEETSKVSLRVFVLNKCIWPFPSQPLTCNIPAPAFEAFNIFKKFYCRQHIGQTLDIYPYRGNADLLVLDHKCFQPGNARSNVDSDSTQSDSTCKQLIFNVSTLQMCILVMFNDSIRISYNDIKNVMAVDEKELKRALLSLACGKKSQRILLKNPANKEICAGDEFSVNESYTTKLCRVKIQTIIEDPEVKEPEVVEPYVRTDDDIKQEIDAAIVRIMKKQALLEHSVLVNSTVEALQNRFTPDQELICIRIGELVSREFISCSLEPGNKKMYAYVP